MDCFVYGLVDPRTGEVRYVGKTTRGYTRIRQHFSPAHLKRDATYKSKWIRALQRLGLMPTCTILEDIEDPRDLDDAERRWIKEGREKGWRLTNLTDGGEGVPGLKNPHTEEWCQKLSVALKGHAVSATTRARLSAANKGRTHTTEARANMSTAQRTLGKRYGVETRAKMSEAQKGHPVSDETRQRQSESAKKRGVAPEHLHKLHEGNKGIKRSPETLARMSEAQIKSWAKRRALNEEQS